MMMMMMMMMVMVMVMVMVMSLLASRTQDGERIEKVEAARRLTALAKF